MTSIGFHSRLCSLIPRLSRSIVNRAASRPVPPQNGGHIFVLHQLYTHDILIDIFTYPVDFLKAIGRSSKVTVEKWEDFWKLSGHELKKSGVAVRDRRCACSHIFLTSFMTTVDRTRYILWCMEKYRRGLPVESYAHEPKPKKTIRG